MKKTAAFLFVLAVSLGQGFADTGVSTPTPAWTPTVPFFLTPTNIHNDSNLADFLNKVNLRYYCLPREGLKSFQCDVTGSWSGELPAGFQNYDQLQSGDPFFNKFTLSYLGQGLNPVLSLTVDNARWAWKKREMEGLATVANQALKQWGKILTQPLFPPDDDQTTYAITPYVDKGFTVAAASLTLTTSVDFDQNAVAKRINLSGEGGAKFMNLVFIPSPRGLLLKDFEYADALKKDNTRGDGFQMDYKTVQGFQLPDTITVFYNYNRRLEKIILKISNYKIEGDVSGAAPTPVNDVKVVSSEFDNAKARHFLWRVSSPTATVYLLGSVHLRPDTSLELPEIIEKSYETSNYVGFEYDMSQQDKIQKEMDAYYKSHYVYPKFDTLQKHLTSKQWQLVRKMLYEDGMEVSAANQLKPVFLAQQLENLIYKKAGMDVHNGIDEIFLRKAQADHKTVLGLENWQEPLKTLDAMDELSEIRWLLSTIVNAQNAVKELNDSLEKWKNGDAGGIESQLSSHLTPEEKPVMDGLIKDRNTKWLDQFDRILKENATYFVVVGSGHLVGKDGLPELLKSKGYKVEQL